MDSIDFEEKLVKSSLVKSGGFKNSFSSISVLLKRVFCECLQISE